LLVLRLRQVPNSVAVRVGTFHMEVTLIVAGRYLELDGNNASHVKTTLVRQGARSRYSLTEAALGAALSRHDLGIEQVLFQCLPIAKLHTDKCS